MQNLEISLWLSPFVIACVYMTNTNPDPTHLALLLVTFMVAFVGIGHATRGG